MRLARQHRDRQTPARVNLAASPAIVSVLSSPLFRSTHRPGGMAREFTFRDARVSRSFPSPTPSPAACLLQRSAGGELARPFPITISSMRKKWCERLHCRCNIETKKGKLVAESTQPTCCCPSAAASQPSAPSGFAILGARCCWLACCAPPEAHILPAGGLQGRRSDFLPCQRATEARVVVPGPVPNPSCRSFPSKV